MAQQSITDSSSFIPAKPEKPPNPAAKKLAQPVTKNLPSEGPANTLPPSKHLPHLPKAVLRPPKPEALEWTCKTCDCSLALGRKEEHVRGKRHAEAVKRAEYLEELAEARELAHDIDTQWGMVPGGGAYSDSSWE